jgi:hypothetical protein
VQSDPAERVRLFALCAQELRFDFLAAMG